MARAQFNLLPDSKYERLKTEKSQRTLKGLFIFISIGATIIFVFFFLATNVLQKKQLSDSDKDIKNLYSELQNVENLNKMLTVQNQLGSLVDLHRNKHVSSRLFTYLPDLTPINVSIGRVGLDLKTNSITIDGTADSQKTVNVFVDTLKFTTFSAGEQANDEQAFLTVVQSNFSVGSGNVSYTLSLTFDPLLFSNNILDANGKQITPSLKVPRLTTTRSVLADPANVLFNGQTTQDKPPGGQ
ncbi:hypothetical protein HYS84_02660 [Candidatus Saccharibacteria bacterium]|nr:hypothetical protein [Candidatus Saccharibacteria bacterium]